MKVLKYNQRECENVQSTGIFWVKNVHLSSIKLFPIIIYFKMLSPEWRFSARRTWRHNPGRLGAVHAGQICNDDIWLFTRFTKHFSGGDDLHAPGVRCQQHWLRLHPGEAGQPGPADWPRGPGLLSTGGRRSRDVISPRKGEQQIDVALVLFLDSFWRRQGA